MNENITITSLIVAGIVALVAMAFAGGNYNSYKIAEMVKAGANPIDARCALAYSNDPICLLRAAKP